MLFIGDIVRVLKPTDGNSRIKNITSKIIDRNASEMGICLKLYPNRDDTWWVYPESVELETDPDRLKQWE